MPKFMVVYRCQHNIEHSGENDAKKAEVFFRLRDNAILIDVEAKSVIQAKGDRTALEKQAKAKGWL